MSSDLFVMLVGKCGCRNDALKYVASARPCRPSKRHELKMKNRRRATFLLGRPSYCNLVVQGGQTNDLYYDHPNNMGTGMAFRPQKHEQVE